MDICYRKSHPHCPDRFSGRDVDKEKGQAITGRQNGETINGIPGRNAGDFVLDNPFTISPNW